MVFTNINTVHSDSKLKAQSVYILLMVKKKKKGRHFRLSAHFA